MKSVQQLNQLHRALLGQAFTFAGSFFHSFKGVLDCSTAQFWKAADGVGFLAASLDFDAVPEPSGVVMVTRDFFPRDVFIGVTEPKESPGLDDDFLG